MTWKRGISNGDRVINKTNFFIIFSASALLFLRERAMSFLSTLSFFPHLSLDILCSLGCPRMFSLASWQAVVCSLPPLPLRGSQLVRTLEGASKHPCVPTYHCLLATFH